MLRLDHLAVSAATLDDGVAHVGAALGVTLPGAVGKHAAMSTHNRLLGLGPAEYLEVIAIDPGAPAPGRPRWFRLDTFAGPPRLSHWILRCDDLAGMLARLRSPERLRATDLARGDFRWRMGVPDDGRLEFDDCFPALIQWQGGLMPPDRLADSGCRLTGLEIAHPDADRIAAVLAPVLADARVRFRAGAPGLRATFATPAGERVLS